MLLHYSFVFVVLETFANFYVSLSDKINLDDGTETISYFALQTYINIELAKQRTILMHKLIAGRPIPLRTCVEERTELN